MRRWQSLPPRQRTKILTLLDGIVWYPHPDNHPQVQAFQSPAFEILYGGQAGGGKSDLLLGLARTCHKSSVLIRRNFPELERSLIKRSLEFYGERRPYYKADKHYWEIDGRRIEFGHMEHIGTPHDPGDERAYSSAPYDLIGFDQLEEFEEYAYQFMFSRVRSTTPGQRKRIVSTANPIGPGVAWIMHRWGAWLDKRHPNPAKSGEVRWYKNDDDGRDVETTADDPDALSRTFISASLADNPYLSYNDDYRRTLSSLPPILRKALLGGDWMASLMDDAMQVIPRAWVEAAMERHRNSERPPIPMTSLGVDVARGGIDDTVLSPRYDVWFAPLIGIPGRLTPDGKSVYAEIMKLSPEIDETTPVAIDVSAIGSSPYDYSFEQGLNVTAVNFASASHMTGGVLHFANKRAELYWAMREALDPNTGANVMLPDDPLLMADLTAAHWRLTTRGIVLQDKDEIRKVLGRSPDRGDAVVISWSGAGDPFGGIHV